MVLEAFSVFGCNCGSGSGSHGYRRDFKSGDSSSSGHWSGDFDYVVCERQLWSRRKINKSVI